MLRFGSRYFSVSLRHGIPSYNVAVVGSGPAGFYTAYHLLNKSNPKDYRLNVDIFDRIPAPYGLSRYGVAPDHPEVKNCEEYLDNLMGKFAGERSEDAGHSVRFFGNVNIGKDISLKQVESYYHSIVLSYGCTSADNKLGIAGEDLPGVVPARKFVNWYNGHPDCFSGENSFEPPDLTKIEDVTIIGNGNVALDVARVLLADPDSRWATTDICEKALAALRNSNVKNVNIVARRGLLESAFTNKEIRELLELSYDGKLRFIPVDEEVFQEIQPYVKDLGRVDKRKMTLLEKHTKLSREEPDKGQKTWSLQYLKSPVEFFAHPTDDKLLSATKFKLNTLHHDPLTKTATVKSLENPKHETLKNELVITSIGYQGSPLVGLEDVNIHFNERKNLLPNNEGRVLLKSDDDHHHVYKKGWYTSGWIKKGPKGVIATTMQESFGTADKILEDLANNVYNDASPNGDITQLLANTSYVTWDQWQVLCKAEFEKGQEKGKVREKVVHKDEMLQIELS